MRGLDFGCYAFRAGGAASADGTRQVHKRSGPGPRGVVTALLGLLSVRDRERLAARLAELRELDRLMREPGTLTGPRHDEDDADKPLP